MSCIRQTRSSSGQMGRESDESVKPGLTRTSPAQSAQLLKCVRVQTILLLQDSAPSPGPSSGV